MVTTIWLDKMLMMQSITKHKSIKIVKARQADKRVTQSEAGHQVLYVLVPEGVSTLLPSTWTQMPHKISLTWHAAT